MKKDIELIMTILYNSTNEMVVFFTYLLMMLKKLNPIDHSFTNTMHMCKNMAVQINADHVQSSNSASQMAMQQFQKDFGKFFMGHLLRNYCSIIRESPPKRQYICELIYAHCRHDLQLRIKVVQSLKKFLKEDEIVYSCHAFLIANEETFREEWFDVFLYYALIGLNNPKVNIRVYSLNVLNTIAQHKAESILDITEKVYKISSERHWEIKAQCLEFAITVLSSYSSMSHLLAQQPAKTNKPGAPAAKGGAAPGEGNSVKSNLNLAVDIINNCFNLDSPKSVQKIGLFKLQALLPDYKILYPQYMAVLIQTDYEIKQIILSDDMDAPIN